MGCIRHPFSHSTLPPISPSTNSGPSTASAAAASSAGAGLGFGFIIASNASSKSKAFRYSSCAMRRSLVGRCPTTCPSYLSCSLSKNSFFSSTRCRTSAITSFVIGEHVPSARATSFSLQTCIWTLVVCGSGAGVVFTGLGGAGVVGGGGIVGYVGQSSAGGGGFSYLVPAQSQWQLHAAGA